LTAPLPTPPPEERPFERLALGSAELSRACWTWIPVTTGLVGLRWAMVALTTIAALGGFWRCIALWEVRRSGMRDGLLQCWFACAAAWAATGIAVTGVELLAMAGLVEESLETSRGIWMAWRMLVGLEITIAVLWVVRESLQRQGIWLAALGGLGAALCALAVGTMATVAILGDRVPDRGLVPVLLGGLTLLSGIAGPLMVADGVGRVLQTISLESLDDETRESAQSPIRDLRR
jgi:hypothetical protein